MKLNNPIPALDRIRSICAAAIVVVCFLISVTCLTELANAQSEVSEGAPEPLKRETGNKADQNLRSLAHVNPSTLAMEMSVPLMSYPGRNGNSLSVDFRYSSKVWRMFDAHAWSIGSGNARQYITDVNPLFAERSAGGWTSSLLPPRIDEGQITYDALGRPYGDSVGEEGLNESYGEALLAILDPIHEFGDNMCSPMTCVSITLFVPVPGGGHAEGRYCATYFYSRCRGTDDDAEPPSPVFESTDLDYVKRLRVVMPDGSSHEFRQEDERIWCGSFKDGCTGSLMGTFLAVDGSRMTLVHDINGYVLSMPDGSRYDFPAEAQSTDGLFANSFTDANGNRMDYFDALESFETPHVWMDTMGRVIADPLPHNDLTQNQTAGVKEIDLPGFDGGTQHYQVTWQNLKPHGCETSQIASCQGYDGMTGGALADQEQKLYYGARFFCIGSVNYDLQDDGYNGDGAGEVLFPDNTLGIRPCTGFDIERDENGDPVLEGGYPIPIPARFNPVVLTNIALPNGKVMNLATTVTARSQRSPIRPGLLRNLIMPGPRRRMAAGHRFGARQTGELSNEGYTITTKAPSFKNGPILFRRRSAPIQITTIRSQRPHRVLIMQMLPAPKP